MASANGKRAHGMWKTTFVRRRRTVASRQRTVAGAGSSGVARGAGAATSVTGHRSAARSHRRRVSLPSAVSRARNFARIRNSRLWFFVTGVRVDFWGPTKNPPLGHPVLLERPSRPTHSVQRFESGGKEGSRRYVARCRSASGEKKRFTSAARCLSLSKSKDPRAVAARAPGLKLQRMP
jgi:hypothetical protein